MNVWIRNRRGVSGSSQIGSSGRMTSSRRTKTNEIRLRVASFKRVFATAGTWCPDPKRISAARVRSTNVKVRSPIPAKATNAGSAPNHQQRPTGSEVASTVRTSATVNSIQTTSNSHKSVMAASIRVVCGSSSMKVGTQPGRWSSRSSSTSGCTAMMFPSWSKI